MANDNIYEVEAITTQSGAMTTSASRKLLNMIFVVDTSGSMRSDGRIKAVNEAFTSMIPTLREIQLNSQSEFELKISIMRFDETAEFIVEPTPILEYNHNEIQPSQWVTYYSRAFELLNEKMSRRTYMAHVGKIAKPYIMLMTDGEPTETDNYVPALDALLENGWFKASQRFAVLIGSDAINSDKAREAVAKFVVNPQEGIINAADAEAIAHEVQARTIHTINIQTQHDVGGMTVDPITGGTTSGTDDPFGNGGLLGGLDDLDTDGGLDGFNDLGLPDPGSFI